MAIDPSNLTAAQLREREDLQKRISELTDEEKSRLAELQGIKESILKTEEQSLKASEKSLENSAILLDRLKGITEKIIIF